jgi:polysaccharide export outer membrane protein
MKSARILAALAIAAIPGTAQKPGTSPDTGANLLARPIRANDLLSINAYGAPELSRTARVGSDGLIRIPLLKERIAARDIMPAELEDRIAQALTDAQILVDPAITVTIAEYGGRPISIAGAVRRPLTFEVSAPITLLDALARAEGLSREAGSEILVTRPARPGSGNPQVAERVLVRELVDAASPLANLALEGGEEIRVPEGGRVYVVGNVRKPGAFRVDESNAMTLMQALALSEGLTPFSARDAFIYRPGENGSKTEIEVALRKIMDRKAPDVALAPNDILYVPDNRRGRVTTNAIERALSFGAGTASGALILGVNR